MNKEIETNKWRIFFKQPTDKDLHESYIELIFRLKSDISGVRMIKKEDLEELEEDIKNLEKWRQFKKLKRELEE
ncbi:MAG: hypothetical protein WC796_02140 [Candidatus Pacearchaeota archaeon]|jgi:hypothetical protein